MPARRAADRVPEQLGVEMGVDVDEAGRDHPSGGVELTSSGFLEDTDIGNAVAVDRHIGAPRGRAGPVDDLATSNHDVMHARMPFRP